MDCSTALSRWSCSADALMLAQARHQSSVVDTYIKLTHYPLPFPSPNTADHRSPTFASDAHIQPQLCHKMPAPDAERIGSAANHVIAAHRLRIRFLHLLYCLLNPEISSPMSDAYSPERVADIKAKSLTMYGKFRVAGHEFSKLDTVEGEREWMRAYERAKGRFEEGAALLRQFEAEAENLAVEWQVAGIRPVKDVPVGEWYGDLEGPLE